MFVIRIVVCRQSAYTVPLPLSAPCVCWEVFSYVHSSMKIRDGEALLLMRVECPFIGGCDTFNRDLTGAWHRKQLNRTEYGQKHKQRINLDFPVAVARVKSTQMSLILSIHFQLIENARKTEIKSKYFLS